MVRRGKKQEQQQRPTGGIPVLANIPHGVDLQEPGANDRTERVAMFRKTKMCKFHILGMCAKGLTCRFAHDRAELHSLPDLSRTKLCKTLINTGSCEDPECRYAHTKQELRDDVGPPPGSQAEATHASLPNMPINPFSVASGQHALPNQAAMLQMMQTGNMQMQPSQLQALMLAIMQQAQGQSAQNGFPPAPYPGLVGWHGQGMAQHEGGSTSLQTDIGKGPNEISLDCATPPNQFGPTPPLSRHGSCNNFSGMEQKPVAAVAAAQLLGSVSKQTPDSPVVQAVNEPAHIPPCALKSIKSSNSISSMLSGGLDTVMEDSSADLGPISTPWGGQFDREPDRSGLLAKNTFLEEVVQQSPSSLRLIQSSSGRLNSALDDKSPSIVGEGVQSEIEAQQSGGLRRSAGSSGSFGSRLHTLAEEDSDSFMKRHMNGRLLDLERRLPDTHLASEPSHIQINSLRSVGSNSALSAMAAEDLHVTQQSSDPDLLYPGLYAGHTDPLQPLNLADVLNNGEGEFRVKNTFLNFQPRSQPAGLRQVMSCSGRLADMR